MRRLAFALMLAVAFIANAVGSPITYSFQSLDDPDAALGATFAYGISDTGEVAGWFIDGSHVTHAFVYGAGSWTTIDNNPLNGGGGNTQAFGINDSGRIFGSLTDSQGFTHNALYDGTSWALLGNDPNDSGNSTFYTGINNSGLLSGSYGSASGDQAFLYDGSTYTTLSNPYGFVTTTVAWGLNNNGEVAGYYYGRLPTSFGNFIAEHGFIFDGTVFTGFDAPDSFSIDAFSTEAFDINDAGTIVGTYTDSSSQKHWFVYDGTTFSDINSPDGTIQFVTGINDAGLIVGRYVDASGVHGFVGTPMPASIPEPSTMTLLAMALGLMIRRLRGGRAGQQVRLTASAAGSAREAPHS